MRRGSSIDHHRALCSQRTNFLSTLSVALHNLKTFSHCMGLFKLIASLIIGGFICSPSGFGVTLIFSSLQTGAQLTTNPNVTLYESPAINGSSLDWPSTTNNLVNIMEWSLLPAAPRPELVVNIQFDYTPLSGDNDIMFGLHDGTNNSGWERSDNGSGSWWSREGPVNGINVPTSFSQHASGLGGVDPFTLTYTLPDEMNAALLNATENGLTTTFAFTNYPVDEDSALTFWIGRQSGESYRLNSLDIQIVAVPEPSATLLIFSLASLGWVIRKYSWPPKKG